MTTQRNVDRIVEAWLDLMPNEAPDRLVGAVMEAVAREPQRRAFVPALRRSSIMSRLFIAAVLAALAIAGVGGAVFIGSQTAIPAPMPKPRPSASAGTIPSAYLVDWIGAPRDVPAFGTSLDNHLAFTNTTVALTGSGYIGRQFNSEAEIVGDTLEVQSTRGSSAGSDPCGPDDVGRYGLTLSPVGSHLTVEAIDDPCGARANAFAGDWYRVACKADNTCFGDLDAGTYPTVNFGPLQDPEIPAIRDFGQLTYTVPAGWSIASDHTSDIRLVRSTDYALETAGGPPDGDTDGIEAWIRPAALSGDPCGFDLDPDVERTPGALVEAIASQPGLDAELPQDVTINGHRGRMLDISVATTWTQTCGFERPVVPLLGEGVGSAGSVGDEPYVVGIMSPARQRLIFLDLGDDRVVAILIRAVDPARFDDFAVEAMEIVETFEFH